MAELNRIIHLDPQAPQLKTPMMAAVDWTKPQQVLGMDVGTADTGCAVLSYAPGAEVQVLGTHTFKGMGYRPAASWGVLGQLMKAYPGISVVVVEVPSRRVYGYAANPRIMECFHQGLGVVQCSLHHGTPAAFVDAHTWQAVGQQVMKDPQKAELFSSTFPGYQGRTNNHSRDAALCAYWWMHVAITNRKPLWNAGL